jgi:hypothetical protein
MNTAEQNGVCNSDSKTQKFNRATGRSNSILGECFAWARGGGDVSCIMAVTRRTLKVPTFKQTWSVTSKGGTDWGERK